MATDQQAEAPALALLRDRIKHAGRHMANPFYNPAAFNDELGRAIAAYRAAVAEEIAAALDHEAAQAEDAWGPDSMTCKLALKHAVLARQIGGNHA